MIYENLAIVCVLQNTRCFAEDGRETFKDSLRAQPLKLLFGGVYFPMRGSSKYRSNDMDFKDP